MKTSEVLQAVLTLEKYLDKKPMTNADKIRAMTDEELADWVDSQFVFSNVFMSKEWWLEWLKQEATE